jgi:hypothetical protein
MALTMMRCELEDEGHMMSKGVEVRCLSIGRAEPSPPGLSASSMFGSPLPCVAGTRGGCALSAIGLY